MLYLYKRGTVVGSLARELRLPVVFPKERLGNTINRRARLSRHINWGCRSKYMVTAPMDTINRNTDMCVSKLRTFQALTAAGISVPRFSDKWEEIASRGKYLARQDFLSEGAGIEIVEEGQQPSAPAHFYSLVVSKAFEVRLHVFLGHIICEQFKFVPQGSNQLIRNYNNGARFSNKTLETHLAPDMSNKLREMAIASLVAVSTDFGAVDMIVSKKGNLYVLEINTAPGIDRGPVQHDQPTTYDAYRNTIQELLV